MKAKEYLIRVYIINRPINMTHEKSKKLRGSLYYRDVFSDSGTSQHSNRGRLGKNVCGVAV